MHRAHLAAGETLLVHGASGGTGLATVQLGQHLGARVIAASRPKEKLTLAKVMGADEVILLGENLRDEILRVTDGQGPDVIFDPVGNDVVDASLPTLAWSWRLLVVGVVGGRIADLKSNYVLIEHVSVIGVRVGELVRRDHAQGARIMHEVDALAAQGVLKPHITARLPLDDGVKALQMLAHGQANCKVVMTM